MLLPLLPEGEEVVADDTPVLTDAQEDELDILAKELGSENRFEIVVLTVTTCPVVCIDLREIARA